MRGVARNPLHEDAAVTGSVLMDCVQRQLADATHGEERRLRRVSNLEARTAALANDFACSTPALHIPQIALILKNANTTILSSIQP